MGKGSGGICWQDIGMLEFKAMSLDEISQEVQAEPSRTETWVPLLREEPVTQEEKPGQVGSCKPQECQIPPTLSKVSAEQRWWSRGLFSGKQPLRETVYGSWTYRVALRFQSCLPSRQLDGSAQRSEPCSPSIISSGLSSSWA